jgi:hypothetical protein
MPENVVHGTVWRWLAGFLYYLKLQILLAPKLRHRTNTIKKLKGTKRGQPVLIIGNGPSTNSISVNQVKALQGRGGDVICMNSYDRNQFSETVVPNYYFLIDPVYEQDQFIEKHSTVDYLNKHPEIHLVESSLANTNLGVTNSRLYINGISAVGLWKSDSPLMANTHPQGVLFSALKFAVYLGYSPIYVTGIDNSYYLHHYHNQMGEIFVKTNGLHSYTDEAVGEVGKTIPYLTRNMSDVLYAHAIFLRDLRKFGRGREIINVGLSDITNDAFPFGCLLRN